MQVMANAVLLSATWQNCWQHATACLSIHHLSPLISRHFTASWLFNGLWAAANYTLSCWELHWITSMQWSRLYSYPSASQDAAKALGFAKHAIKFLFNSTLSKLRPIKISLLTRFSVGPQGFPIPSELHPKDSNIWTPWKKYLHSISVHVCKH